jgi:predicted DNA-binding transcriptional regulator AlpA
MTALVIRTVDGTELPPTLDTAQAAKWLGCSSDLLWDLARTGQAPVEPLRLGARRLRWPTARLLEVLGIEQPTQRADVTELEAHRA